MSTLDKKIAILPIEVEDDFGLPILGCDIAVYDDTTSLADFLFAMDAFAEQYIADCRGCDGCCKERAPLIAADIAALGTLLPENTFPVHAVCRAFAEIDVRRNGSVDIYFRRLQNGACNLLNQKEKICQEHACRAFVCRSHFCLPRSEAISRLREEVVNMGENELTRLLLAEELNGALPITPKPLLEMINPADYPPNEQSGKKTYADIILREVLSEGLWQQIKKEG